MKGEVNPFSHGRQSESFCKWRSLHLLAIWNNVVVLIFSNWKQYPFFSQPFKLIGRHLKILMPVSKMGLWFFFCFFVGTSFEAWGLTEREHWRRALWYVLFNCRHMLLFNARRRQFKVYMSAVWYCLIWCRTDTLNLLLSVLEQVMILCALFHDAQQALK